MACPQKTLVAPTTAATDARMLPRILKARDVMKYYNIGRSRLYHLVATGELLARRAGPLFVFRVEDVEAYFDSLPPAELSDHVGLPDTSTPAAQQKTRRA
jgi:hypothetical protein